MQTPGWGFPTQVQGSCCASPVSSHTWNSWRCGWLAPGSRGHRSGVGGNHRLGPDTSKSLSCPHLSAHMVAMVTTGRSPHPESHSAPAGNIQCRARLHKAGLGKALGPRGYGDTDGESQPELGVEVLSGGHKGVLTGHAVMFWVQRLMLELSSSVLQRCCFLSQPQYGSRAPRHALPDRGPETHAHWPPSLTCIPRTYLTTPH